MAGRIGERMALRWRLVGLLLVVSVSVALPYLVTRDSTNSAMQARTWVAHTSQVKSVVYRVLFQVRDMESAVYSSINDFGNKQYLKLRLERDASEVSDLLDNLRNLTEDNNAQQVRIGSFEAVVRGRMKLLAQAADLASKGDCLRRVVRWPAHVPLPPHRARYCRH